MKKWMCVLLALGVANAWQAARAQRVVHESIAQWRAVPALRLVKERQWCMDVDAPGCDFKGPASLRALPDGGILAADGMGPLNLFGADGRFVRALGRKGKGPGEYGFVVDANLASNGLVNWFDNTQMRIATVKLDGTAGPVTRLMPPHTMANLFLVDTQLVILDVPPGAKLGDTVLASYRTVPVSGTPTVLARVRTAAVFVPGSEGFMQMRGPFRPSAIGHVGAAGDVAHSNGARYDVEFLPREMAAWRLRIDMPVRAVTAADRDSAEARLLKTFKAPNLAALPAAMRERFQDAGSTFPPLIDIRVMRDGTLWVHPQPEVGAKQARWDVFSKIGKRMGYVALPFTARVWDGAADWVLVSELGDDDIPTFVRYKVGGR